MSVRKKKKNEVVESAKVDKVPKKRGADKKQKQMPEKSSKGMVLLAIAIAVLGVVGYYYWGDYNLLYGFGSLVAGLGLGAVVFFLSSTGRQFVTFTKEARIELRRVFWPTMDETRRMTILVLIVMAVVMLFLMFVDFILKHLISWILSFS